MAKTRRGLRGARATTRSLVAARPCTSERRAVGSTTARIRGGAASAAAPMLCKPPAPLGPRRALTRGAEVPAVTDSGFAPVTGRAARVELSRVEVAGVEVAVPATAMFCRAEPTVARGAPLAIGEPRLGRTGATSVGSASLLRDRSLGSAGRGRVLEANTSAFAFARWARRLGAARFREGVDIRGAPFAVVCSPVGGARRPFPRQARERSARRPGRPHWPLGG